MNTKLFYKVSVTTGTTSGTRWFETTEEALAFTVDACIAGGVLQRVSIARIPKPDWVQVTAYTETCNTPQL